MKIKIKQEELKKFQVKISITTYDQITVDAKNKKEAKDKAIGLYEEYNMSYLPMDDLPNGEKQIEVIDISMCDN